MGIVLIVIIDAAGMPTAAPPGSQWNPRELRNLLILSSSPSELTLSPLLRGLAFEEFGLGQAHCSVGLRESLKAFLL